ncbi:MAG: hypothetical protein CEN89_762 [Candidatus Berkelbacteria bacterium Licking1014_7]|uniref:Uncharacterized protein n=1 Tax=Candidatus Berkelbacteria bacterium Licking1014_7 TaxID=2017147 RepID=A0A554LI31_9BACT|nr:MAG: hypothetical protein CEN89_762 [Candidatus Berkelbacteria bacterium Licking1014_7]
MEYLKMRFNPLYFRHCITLCLPRCDSLRGNLPPAIAIAQAISGQAKLHLKMQNYLLRLSPFAD